MRTDVLERAAQRDKQRAERVLLWRFDDTWKNFLGYLYWRNRFPVLTRICSRAMLFVELYLVYRFFHFNAVVSLSLILFCVFVFQGLYQGITQFFRIMIISERQRGNFVKANEISFLLLALSLLLGIVLPAIAAGAAWFSGADSLDLVFVAIWIIILPLDLCSSVFWMVTYTVKRLRRRFSFIILCRIIPALSILLFYRLLGPYSYALGLVLARGMESIYLIVVARDALARVGVVPEKSKKPLRVFFKLLHHPSFLKYSLFPVPYQAYSLSLAVLLFVRSGELWVTHFIFLHLVMIVSYVALRIAQSMGMDVYLALRNSDLALAEAFKFRVERGVVAALAAIVILFCTALVSHTAFFTLTAEIMYELWIYFLAAVVFRTLFQTEVTLHRAAGTECCFNKLLFASLILVMIPLQSVLILYFRANLPLVYLLDSCCFFLLSVFLFRAKYFRISVIYDQAIRRRLVDQRVITPALWLSYLAVWRKTKLPFSLLVVQLDQRYKSVPMERLFLNEMSQVFANAELACPLMPGVFLYLLPAQDGAQAKEFRGFLLSHYAGHVRNAVCIDPASTLEANLEMLLSCFAKVRETRKQAKMIARKLGQLVEEDMIREFRSLYSLIDRRPANAFAPFNRKSGCRLIARILKERAFDEIPCIYFDGRRRKSCGKASSEHVRFAQQVFSQFQGTSMFIPPQKRPFAVFSIFGIPLAVVDAQSLDAKKKEEIYLLSLAVTLGLSVELALRLERLGDIPIGLFELIRDRLEQVADSLPGLCALRIEKQVSDENTCLLSTETTSGRQTLCFSYAE